MIPESKSESELKSTTKTKTKTKLKRLERRRDEREGGGQKGDSKRRRKENERLEGDLIAEVCIRFSFSFFISRNKILFYMFAGFSSIDSFEHYFFLSLFPFFFPCSFPRSNCLIFLYLYEEFPFSSLNLTSTPP